MEKLITYILGLESGDKINLFMAVTPVVTALVTANYFLRRRKKKLAAWRDDFLECCKVSHFNFSTLVAALGPTDFQDYLPMDVDEILSGFLTTRTNVLLIGRPGSGKTHTALNGIRAVYPEWNLLVPRRSAIEKLTKVLIPKEKYILLLDDVDRFIDIDRPDGSHTLFEFVETLHSQAKELVVVATVRSTLPHASEISEIFRTFKSWQRVRIEDWTKQQAQRLATLANSSLDHWDGTPLSVKRPPIEIIQRIDLASDGTRRVVWALKLLVSRAITPIQQQILVELASLSIFPGNLDELRDSLRFLSDIGFLKENSQFVVPYDAYVDAIELPSNLTSIDEKLITVFAKHDGWRELRQLTDWATDNEKYQLAQTAGIKAVTGNPQHSRNHYSLGRVLGRIGDLEGAKEHYAEATKLTPQWATCWVRLASTLRKLGSNDEADKALKTFHRVCKSSHSAHLMVADMLVEDGRIEEGLEKYDELLAIEPDQIGALRAKAKLLLTTERWDLALSAHEALITADPDSPFGYWNLGAVYQGLGDYRAAVKTVEKTLELEPGLEPAWITLVFLCLRLNMISKAQDAVDKGLQRFPRSAKLLSYKGQLLNQKKRHIEAEECLRKAIKVDPEYSEAWVGLGLSLRMQSKTEEAIAANKEAIKFDAKAYSAYFGLTLAFLNTDLQVAEEYVRKCLKIKPDFNLARFTLARILARRSHHSKSLEELENMKRFGFKFHERLALDRDFSSVWGDPRFVALYQ